MAVRGLRAQTPGSQAVEASPSATPSRVRHGRTRLAQEEPRTGSPSTSAIGRTATPQQAGTGTTDAQQAPIAGQQMSSPQVAPGISQAGPRAETTMANAATNDKTAQSSSLAASNPAIAALHAHLSASLFQPACADIRFRALGRVYALHRVILVQASFFHDLLSGDFHEAKTRRGVWRARAGEDGGQSTEEELEAIDLHFDDCNITRPAFEFCIATLYGAAPELVLPPWASPTPAHPLTEFFDPSKLADTDDSRVDSQLAESVQEASAHGKPQHPATPRFLLSLLATATYLGIPSVSAQAVTLIMCSLTPFTISHYLNFSLGAGIQGAAEAKLRREQGGSDLWDWELEGPAWGLSSLSTVDYSHLQGDTSDSSLVAQTQRLNVGERRPSSSLSEASVSSDRGAKESNAASPGSKSRAQANGAIGEVVDSTDASVLEMTGDKQHESQHYYYGTQSDRIGEVCSCWLMRWGTDVLLGEEMIQAREQGLGRQQSIAEELVPYCQLPAPHSMTADDCPSDVGRLIKAPRAAVWCHPHQHGIPARSMRELISSDGFWVRTEWDRFEVARRVVAMRRCFADKLADSQEQAFSDLEYASSSSSSDEGGLDMRVKLAHKTKTSCRGKKPALESQNPSLQAAQLVSDEDDDETEYRRLFSEGIYYTHMSFAELSAISNQICPSTALPYAPGNVLQSALWSQSELRNIIVNFDCAKKSEENADAGSASEGGEAANTSVDDLASITPSKADKEIETTPELGLGLTSLEEDFGKAYKSISRRGRASRSHLGNDRRPFSLGGVTPSMQHGGNVNALEGMLSRRFYAVCVDDTIRVGENMFCLASGSSDPNTHNTVSTPRRAEAPSGVAALSDPHTLPLSDEVKRGTAENFFGLGNAVKSGKDLGRQHAKSERREIEGEEMQERATTVFPRAQGGFGSSDVPYTEWTGFEPMRMGLEFYGVDRLMEKQRMYSPSFFYAGSVWNLYVQTVRKPKGLQLGIYLHRQNHNDPLPLPSMLSRLTSPSGAQSHALQPTNASTASAAIADDADTSEPQMHPRSASTGYSAQTTGSVFYTNVPDRSIAYGSAARSVNPRLISTHPYALTPSPSSTALGTASLQRPNQSQSTSNIHSSASHANLSSGIGPRNDVAGGGVASAASAHAAHQIRPETSSTASTAQTTQASGAQALAVPYLDQRRVLHAFFSIYCPSPTGTCMTKFSSEPDNFSLSQSWGWKSSSLLGHVSLEDQRLGSAKSHVAETFRCIVTIGLV